jgi:hypothetical protein
MMTPTYSRITIDKYLHDLEAALAHLPEPERNDVVAGIRDHIEAALAEVENPDSSDVQRILDNLGDPLAVGASARGPGLAPDSVRPSLTEREWVPAATVLSLVLGAALFFLIVPLAFWATGIVLLWVSPLWRVGEKVLGTLFLGPASVIITGTSLSAVEHQTCEQTSSEAAWVCESSGSIWPLRIIVALLVVAILAAGAYLWRRGSSRARMVRR